MKKKWICLLTALTLTVGVFAAKPLVGGAAAMIDLEKKCSVKVYPENPMTTQFGEELTEADVVVDLYKVADAEKIPGYDSYTYKFIGNYTGLSVAEDSSAEAWKKLAQEAAGIALDSENPDTVPEELKGISVTADETRKIDGLETGLYLMIARGSDLTEIADYRINLDQESTEGEEKTTSIATIANSSKYQYAFEPQLFSVPMRGTSSVLDMLEVPEEGYNTADPLEWVYDLIVYLKPEQLPRFGDLRIIKTLESHEEQETPGITRPEEEGKEPKPGINPGPDPMKDPVTCVFKIEVTRGEDEDMSKYNRVESITFTSAGTESVTIRKIPAGCTVKVTEVYSGASYEMTVGPDGPVTIAADDVVEVNFRNEFNWKRTGGYGIKNQFTYDGEEGEWNLVKDPEQDTPESIAETNE